jgi:D-galactarolactone cycloisomerase
VGGGVRPAAHRCDLVEQTFAEAIVGEEPIVAESLAERVYAGDIGGYHFACGGFVQAALSGVEVALWDLRGKELDAPVHELLGGGRTESLVPYASTMYVTEWGQDPAEPVAETADEGFTAAKIKIGCGADGDLEHVATASEHLGEDVYLIADYNDNYTPRQAIRSIEALAECDLTWAEGPVPPENLPGYREIKRHTDVPLAAGEAHFGRFEFKRLVDERLMDVIQPNLGRCSGFVEARFLANLAITENVLVQPHIWNSAVGTAAAVQFAASFPDYPYAADLLPEPVLFEFDRSENPLRDDLLVDPLDPTGGSLDVPQELGLGVTVGEDAVEQHRTN